MIVELAERVKDLLNATVFTEDFTATRQYLPRFDLDNLKTLAVTVVPRTLETAMLTRARDQHEIAVDVAVQQRVNAEDNDTIDALLNLVQQIADALNRTTLDDYVWQGTVNDPIYAPDHLYEKRVFTSVLTVTYRVARDAGTLAATGTGT